jgi:hypothetical protein
MVLAMRNPGEMPGPAPEHLTDAQRRRLGRIEKRGREERLDHVLIFGRSYAT